MAEGTLPLGAVAVAGVGLIGGSFALALRAAGAAHTIYGLGRSAASLERAVALGVIDRAVAADDPVLKTVDLVLAAVPVGQMPDLFRRLEASIGPHTVVTDGGSTKQDVVAAGRAAFVGSLERFVPGHPIAGAERSGVDAARVDLYRGRRTVLTPLPESAPWAVERVRAVWQACGAEIAVMAPAAHDRIFAAVSHLPHLLSFALVDDIAGRPDGAELLAYAASGFRDFTRIAGSDPEMWRDICLANRAALLPELDAYLDATHRLREALATGDGATLHKVFATARRTRTAWADGKAAAARPDPEPDPAAPADGRGA